MLVKANLQSTITTRWRSKRTSLSNDSQNNSVKDWDQWITLWQEWKINNMGHLLFPWSITKSYHFPSGFPLYKASVGSSSLNNHSLPGILTQHLTQCNSDVTTTPIPTHDLHVAKWLEEILNIVQHCNFYAGHELLKDTFKYSPCVMVMSCTQGLEKPIHTQEVVFKWWKTSEEATEVNFLHKERSKVVCGLFQISN